MVSVVSVVILPCKYIGGGLTLLWSVGQFVSQCFYYLLRLCVPLHSLGILQRCKIYCVGMFGFNVSIPGVVDPKLVRENNLFLVIIGIIFCSITFLFPADHMVDVVSVFSFFRSFLL